MKNKIQLIKIITAAIIIIPIFLWLFGISYFTQYESMSNSTQNSSLNENGILQPQSFHEGSLDNSTTELYDKETDFYSQKIEESSFNDESPKIKIKVKNGFAYLRPSQIMYVTTLGNKVKIETISTLNIEPKITLTALYEKLKNIDEEYFFKTKSALINCNYIVQLATKNTKYNGSYLYQYKVLMEDGEKINISDDKATELFKILDNLTY